MKKWIMVLLVSLLTLAGCQLKPQKKDIGHGHFRKVTFALVSSAENSTTNYNHEYSYIEDIKDGRGYTAGMIGFTSRTGDLLDVVKTYCKLKPHQNILEKYIHALEKVHKSSSHKGLGSDFVKAWRQAGKDPKMIKAQNKIINKQYLQPAISYAKKDGLSPLGQYIYYDALVVHGPGSSNDRTSFQGMRNEVQKTVNAPASVGNQKTYLTAFLDVRKKIMQEEPAHQNLSRINVQRKLLKDGNYELKTPLHWKMYGQKFDLTDYKLKSLK